MLKEPVRYEDAREASEPVAQVVEHVTFNHGVEGSSPSGLTIAWTSKGSTDNKMGGDAT
jgi:hypothetical protein